MSRFLTNAQTPRFGATRYRMEASDATAAATFSGFASGAQTLAVTLYTCTSDGTLTQRGQGTAAVAENFDGTKTVNVTVAANVDVPTDGGVAVKVAIAGVEQTFYSPVATVESIGAGTHAFTIKCWESEEDSDAGVHYGNAQSYGPNGIFEDHGPWSNDFSSLITSALEVAGLTSAVALDAAVLTQAHALTVAGLTSAAAIDHLSLAGAQELVTADIAIVVNMDTPTLAVGATAGPWSNDFASLVENQPLVTQGLTAAVSLEAPVLTAWEIIEAAQATSPYSDGAYDATPLTWGSDYQYRVTDSLGVVVTSNAAQFRGIQVAGLTAASGIDNVELDATPSITTADVAVPVTIDTPALVQHHTLVVAGLTAAVAVDAPTLTYHSTTTLVVAGLTAAVAVDAPTLTQAHTLVVSGITVELLVEGVALVYAGDILLGIADLSCGVTLETVALIQHHALAVAGVDARVTIDSLSFTAPLAPFSLALSGGDDATRLVLGATDATRLEVEVT